MNDQRRMVFMPGRCFYVCWALGRHAHFFVVRTQALALGRSSTSALSAYPLACPSGHPAWVSLDLKRVTMFYPCSRERTSPVHAGAFDISLNRC